MGGAKKERKPPKIIASMDDASNDSHQLADIFKKLADYSLSLEAVSKTTLREMIESSVKDSDLTHMKSEIAKTDTSRTISDITKPIQNEKARYSVSNSIRAMVTSGMAIVYPEGASWPKDPTYAHFSILIQIFILTGPSFRPTQRNKYRLRILSKAENVAGGISPLLSDRDKEKRTD